jgi:aryl-alcohol dehydrogenase-like predicted oxidoreductase
MIKLNNEYYKLAPDLTIRRIVNGMWQVAGGHGHIDSERAILDMVKYHDAGFRTWDLADIYGPAEDFIGEFRTKISNIKGEAELDNIQALTKWVPQPRTITRSVVRDNIQKSLSRMRVSSLDLLQFHWWDYTNPYYMDALKYLFDLKDEGLIKQVGLTNFDTERMQIMKDQGLQIVSNQIQYSIIDRRPEVKMMQFCLEHDISLLTYGTLCGGLISDRFQGKPEPSSIELDTLSLRKYKRMIDLWGGWNLFQELLLILKRIAQKHNVSISNVATSYILGKSAVAGVIVGARLGVVDHRSDNARVFGLNLDKSDIDTINAICARAKNLFDIIGDCGDEYR